MPLVVCEFERQVSSLVGISLGASFARVLRCRDQQHGRGRITDLLREIKYHPQNTTHFEPRHIQYVPVRNEVVEIVETQMAETNGDLVTFGEGRTILTLHFKREVVV